VKLGLIGLSLLSLRPIEDLGEAFDLLPPIVLKLVELGP
jgi:hypothetical protein